MAPPTRHVPAALIRVHVLTRSCLEFGAMLLIGVTSRRASLSLGLLGAIASCATYPGEANAQNTLAIYNFVGQPGNQATTLVTNVAMGLTASDLARSNDLVPAGHSDTMAATNWPTTPNLANINLGFYTFTLTPNGGSILNLSQLQIPLEGPSSGPNQVVVRSSLNNFATNIAAPFTVPQGQPLTYSVDLTATMFQNLVSPITFHVYGFGANHANGQLRFFPNTVVTGTVTPVPEPALMLSVASVFGGLAWRLRRVAGLICKL